MAGKAVPSVLGADAAGRAAEAPTTLAYSREELLEKYHGVLRAFRARRRRAPLRLRRWRRVTLFRARRAAFKKRATVTSGRRGRGPPTSMPRRRAQGERRAAASPCLQAARKETVLAAVQWQVSHLGERVGEAAHPGPPPCSRAGSAHLDAAQADLGGAAPQSAGAAPPLAAWTAGDVCARLEQEGLPAPIVNRFQENEVSGADLLTLESDDLRQHLGLTRFGDRKATWLAVLRIRGRSSSRVAGLSPPARATAAVPIPANRSQKTRNPFEEMGNARIREELREAKAKIKTLEEQNRNNEREKRELQVRAKEAEERRSDAEGRCTEAQQRLKGAKRDMEKATAQESAAPAAAASAAPAAAASPQSAPCPAPPQPQLGPAAKRRRAEAEAPPQGSPPAAAQQLMPIYVDCGGETHCVEVSHLATVGELAAAVPGQGEMGVTIYFGGEALDNMTTLADAGIGAEVRVEALRAAVRIFAAGNNVHGQLGIPPVGRDRHKAFLSPVAADGLQPPQGAEIAELHCGRRFVLLRTVQGHVLHAGSNEYGQRGDGNMDEEPHPSLSRVPLPAPAVSIAAGAWHAAAVLSDRSVHTWGDKRYRQLGRRGDGAVPQAVPGISDAERVSAGHLFTFAHRRGGEVSAWGENHYGQLCLGRPGTNEAVTSEAVPQRVAALCGVPLLHLTGGHTHCIALRADGRALAWGALDHGVPVRLADGSARWTAQRGCLPIVLQIGPQLSVAAGRGFCGSVGRDGVLRLWGRGHAQQPTAVPLPGGAAAHEVVCGDGARVFARSSGGEWAAKWNFNYELPYRSGDEVHQLRPLPEALAGCRRVVAGPSCEFVLYLCPQ